MASSNGNSFGNEVAAVGNMALVECVCAYKREGHKSIMIITIIGAMKNHKNVDSKKRLVVV